MPRGYVQHRIEAELIHIGGADLLQISETGRAGFQHVDDLLLREQIGPGDHFAHVAEMRVGTAVIRGRILQSERDMAVRTARLKPLLTLASFRRWR